MIVKTVRGYLVPTPVLLDPESVIADVILDLIEDKDWTRSFKTPPPKVSAEVVKTEISGDDVVIYIRCTEEEFLEVDKWLSIIEDEEP